MTEVLFNGLAGRLEGRYHQSDKPGAPIALILHPHPQYGGTMNNKVVYTLFSCFEKLGFSVLRFNFRSVGWLLIGCNRLIRKLVNVGSPDIRSELGSDCNF